MGAFITLESGLEHRHLQVTFERVEHVNANSSTPVKLVNFKQQLATSIAIDASIAFTVVRISNQKRDHH